MIGNCCEDGLYENDRLFVGRTAEVAVLPMLVLPMNTWRKEHLLEQRRDFGGEDDFGERDGS